MENDLSDKIKREVVQAIAVSILQNDCTIWILPKHLNKKLNDNNVRMLWAILNKYLEQHATK